MTVNQIPILLDVYGKEVPQYFDSVSNSWVVSSTGSPIPSGLSYAMAAAAGKITGKQSVTSFGYSPNTSGGVSNVNLWEPLVIWSLPTSPVSIEALSSSASDGVGGTGARSIFLIGVGPGFVYQNEQVVMNGTSIVNSSLTWLAINTVIVFDNATTGFGSNGTNVGNITVRIAGAGAIQGYILAGSGVSHHGRYTVPAGNTLLVNNFFITGTKSGGATTTFSLDAMFISPNGLYYKGLPQTLQNGSVSTVSLPHTPVNVNEKNTLMFRINNVSAGGIDIGAGYTGLQITN